MAEYKSARVNLNITEEGYQRYVINLYPNKLAVIDMLLHAIWIVVALFFAFRTSNMGLGTTIAASLGGMTLTLLLGTFLPLGFLLGGGALFLGIVTLPSHIVGGPLGLYGLHSFLKSLSKWYGRDLVKRWCTSREEQFLQAVAERTIRVTANRYATEDTRLFLRQLAQVVGLDEGEKT
jgi:hypothetical protein